MGAITFAHIPHFLSVIPAYWSDFFSGKVEPSAPHFWLIALTVIGGALVGLAIIWEAARDGHLWTLPTAMVVLGVVIEASATVVLFEFDEGISGVQSKLIAETNERAAGLKLEALKLQEQLVAQGPREALLRGSIRKTLVDSLKPFAGQKIDVRFSAARSWGASGNWEIVAIGDDVLGLSQTFIGILKGANWKSPDKPLVSEFRGNGLRVEVLQKASQRTMKAASALAEALRKVPLAVEGPVRISPEQAKRVPMDKALPEFGDGTVILTVLTHP